MKLEDCFIEVIKGRVIVAHIVTPQAIDELLAEPGEPIPARPPSQSVTYDIELFMKGGLFWLRFKMSTSDRVYWDCAVNWDDMLYGMTVFRLLDLWEISDLSLPLTPIEIQSQE
jgi:hypothetical protein